MSPFAVVLWVKSEHGIRAYGDAGEHLTPLGDFEDFATMRVELEAKGDADGKTQYRNVGG
jgi:hypothetical protein